MDKKILYILALLLTATACENVIDVDFGQSEPQFVLNAQLLSDSRAQQVYVSESSRSLLQPVLDAQVSVEVDGKTVVATLLPEEEQNEYAGVYGFSCPIPVGSQVKVTARRDSREAWAQSEVLPGAVITAVDTLRVTEQNLDSTEENFQFKISFQDLPGLSYYRIGVRADFTIRMVNSSGETLDVFSTYEFPVSGAGDPILSGSAVSISILDLEPTYLVFSDEMFRDQLCTVRLSVPVQQLYPFYYSWEGSFYPSHAIIMASYVPWLETLPAEEFHYLSALNNLENFGYDAQLIVEPTTLPCNVQGGLGFVGVRNRVEGPAIQPKEKYIDYTYYGYDYE